MKKPEVIIGTSEKYMVGYIINTTKEGTLTADISFAKNISAGIKSIAISKKHLIASSNVENGLYCFNLNTRKEHIPEYVESKVIDIQVYDGHLFMAVGDEDNCNIVIFGKNSFDIMAEIEVEDKPIKGMTVNEEANTLLTFSESDTVSIYDLKELSLLEKIKVKKNLSMCLCSPDGEYFVAVYGSRLNIRTYKDNVSIHSEDVGQTIKCIKFLTDDLLAIGGEKNSIFVFSLKTSSMKTELPKAHDRRIKSLACIPTKTPDTIYLVSGSSDGFIKIWSLNIVKFDEPQLICEKNSECRITCMGVRQVPISWNKGVQSEENQPEKTAQIKEATPVEKQEKSNYSDLDDKDDSITTTHEKENNKKKSNACKKRKRKQLGEKIDADNYLSSIDSSHSKKSELPINPKKLKNKNSKTFKHQNEISHDVSVSTISPQSESSSTSNVSSSTLSSEDQNNMSTSNAISVDSVSETKSKTEKKKKSNHIIVTDEVCRKQQKKSKKCVTDEVSGKQQKKSKKCEVIEQNIDKEKTNFTPVSQVDSISKKPKFDFNPVDGTDEIKNKKLKKKKNRLENKKDLEQQKENKCFVDNNNLNEQVKTNCNEAKEISKKVKKNKKSSQGNEYKFNVSEECNNNLEKGFDSTNYKGENSNFIEKSQNKLTKKLKRKRCEESSVDSSLDNTNRYKMELDNGKSSTLSKKIKCDDLCETENRNSGNVIKIEKKKKHKKVISH